MKQILYADDLVSMSESIENLKEFLKWKETFESKAEGEPQENQSNGEWFER